MKGSECRQAVAKALDVGYRLLDTAQVYGNEEEVGQGIADSGVARQDIFLTTKHWMRPPARETVMQQAEESLSKLGTDYVDLLLIHWRQLDVSLPDTLEAMNELAAQGKAKRIGVSNFTVELMRQAQELSVVPIFTNQIEYHPYLAQTAVVAYARRHGIAITSYCPLAKGEACSDPVLVEIARAHGKSAAQVVLRWHIQQDGVAAIPKAAQEDHIRANLDIFDFELSPEEMQSVHALARGQRLISPRFAPKWDE